MTTSVVNPLAPAAGYPDRRTPGPAERVGDSSRHGLLVAVRDDADIDVVLGPAALLARAARRPLVVALVRPRVPWTTNALLNGVIADRTAREVAKRTRRSESRCARIGVRVHDVLTVTQPFGIGPHRRHRALQRRLTALARRAGAELHVRPSAPRPVPAGQVAVGVEPRGRS